MSMQCQSRGISARSNLAETCHAMLVSTGAMSKSRHQQLLQSLPVNFCGPRVYPHKLVDHWFQPHCDFDWFSTSTCDMEFVSAIWVGHVFQGRCLPKAFHLAHGITLWCQDVNICWNSVGILLVILIDSPISPSISPGISMDFRRFPGARQRLAMLSFRTGRSLNSTETVRLKLCEFTNLYEL